MDNDYTTTSITLKWDHKSWIVKKSINLSQYLAKKIDEDMKNG